MVTVESLVVSWGVPIASGLVISLSMFFLARHYGMLDKTRIDSTTNTFNITTVQRDYQEIKSDMKENKEYTDKRIERLISELDKREREKNEEHRRIWEKINALNTVIEVVKDRLNRGNVTQ